MKRYIIITVLATMAMTFSVSAETKEKCVEIDVINKSCDNIFKPSQSTTVFPVFGTTNNPLCTETTKPATEQTTVIKPPFEITTTAKPTVETTTEITTVAKPTTESTTETTTSIQNNSDYRTQVLNLVNQHRRQNGLSDLKLNSKLSEVAQIKAEDMKNNNYFSHNSPTYGTPFDMMNKFGISYKTAGENIAKGQKTPEAVVNAWMNSEGHRANILNSNYKEMGLGFTNGTVYWCQMFIG